MRPVRASEIYTKRRLLLYTPWSVYLLAVVQAEPHVRHVTSLHAARTAAARQPIVCSDANLRCANRGCLMRDDAIGNAPTDAKWLWALWPRSPRLRL